MASLTSDKIARKIQEFLVFLEFQFFVNATGARDSERCISKALYCSQNEEEQFVTFATGARDSERRIPKVLYC